MSPVRHQRRRRGGLIGGIAALALAAGVVVWSQSGGSDDVSGPHLGRDTYDATDIESAYTPDATDAGATGDASA